MNRSRNELFRGWRAPGAPHGLKARVLAAARAVSGRSRPPRIEDRLWESRALRWGWAVAAMVLLAINLIVVAPPPDVQRVVDRGQGDRLTDDPVVIALLERRPVAPRPRLGEQTELLNSLLVMGPTTGSTS